MMLNKTIFSMLLALSGAWLTKNTGIGFASAKSVEHLPLESQQAERRETPEYYSTRVNLAPTNNGGPPQSGSHDNRANGQASAIYIERVSPKSPKPGRPYWDQFNINVAPVNNAQYNNYYYPTQKPYDQKN